MKILKLLVLLCLVLSTLARRYHRRSGAPKKGDNTEAIAKLFKDENSNCKSYEELINYDTLNMNFPGTSVKGDCVIDCTNFGLQIVSLVNYINKEVKIDEDKVNTFLLKLGRHKWGLQNCKLPHLRDRRQK